MPIQDEVEAWILGCWRGDVDEDTVRAVVTALFVGPPRTVNVESTLARFLGHPNIRAILDRDPTAGEIAKAYLRHKFFALIPDDAVGQVVQDVADRAHRALTHQLMATIRMGRASRDEIEGLWVEFAMWLVRSLQTAQSATMWLHGAEAEVADPPVSPPPFCDCSTGYWVAAGGAPDLAAEAAAAQPVADGALPADDDADDVADVAVWWHPSISLLRLIRGRGLGQWRTGNFWPAAFISSPVGNLLRSNDLAQPRHVVTCYVECACGHRHSFLTTLACECERCRAASPVRYRDRWLLWTGIPGDELKVEVCPVCRRVRDGIASPQCPDCESAQAESLWRMSTVDGLGIAAPVGAPAPGAPDDAPGLDVADQEVEDFEDWIDWSRLTALRLQQVREFYLTELAEARNAQAAVHRCSVLGSQTGAPCITDAVKNPPTLPVGWEMVFVERLLGRERIPEVLKAIRRCVGGVCAELPQDYPGPLNANYHKQIRFKLAKRLRSHLGL